MNYLSLFVCTIFVFSFGCGDVSEKLNAGGARLEVVEANNITLDGKPVRGAIVICVNYNKTQDCLDLLSGLDGMDGKDGKDGLDGQPGLPGADGEDGKDGIDGEDGIVLPKPCKGKKCEK